MPKQHCWNLRFMFVRLHCLGWNMFTFSFIVKMSPPTSKSLVYQILCSLMARAVAESAQVQDLYVLKHVD
uniref:Putative secreted protein n=1 Tax=Ixodes ricinus TaxID=34613 RepID=A0A6B0TXA5_IXORI